MPFLGNAEGFLDYSRLNGGKILKVLKGGRVTMSREHMRKLDLKVGDFVIAKTEGGRIVIVPAKVKEKV